MNSSARSQSHLYSCLTLTLVAVIAKIETQRTANISQCKCLRYQRGKVAESLTPSRQQAGFTLGQNTIVATKVGMCCMQRMWLTSFKHPISLS